MVPVFVLVSPREINKQELAAIKPESLGFVTPDVNTWYLDEAGDLYQYSFAGDLAEAVKPLLLSPVYAIKRGGKTAVLGDRQPALAVLPGNEPLEYFDGQQQSFLKLQENQVSHPGENWEKPARLWQKWREAALNPAEAEMENQRGLLLEQSRALGVLIPSTSFMVLENSAQARILERKQAQSLANKSALEFDEEQETPEPPEWLLLLLVIGLMAFSRRRALRSLHP